MWAVINNHNSVVDLLLSTPNIDVNQKDNQGKCALHWAVYNKDNEALKLLLNVPNIDVNIVDKHGYSAVHRAVVCGDNIEGLKLLLSHPSLTSLTLNQRERLYGDTPVMLAVKQNSSKHLKVLAADPRVDLDTTDMEGRSLEEVATWWPLANPFWIGDRETCQKLVDEIKLKREERRRLIRKQQRQVSKVLLDGLYDPDSPISKLLGVRMEVVGEIIWQKLVENWQIYPEQDEQDEDVQ